MLYRGYMRIILATILSLFVTAVIIFTTRIWGLGQHFPQFQSPFFEGEKPLIIAKVDTLEKAQQAIEAKPQIALWLDVRVSLDRVVYVLPPAKDGPFLNAKAEQQEANPTKKIMLGGKVSDYPFEQVKEFYKEVSTLKDFYSRFAKTRFVLNVIDNVHEVQTAVAEDIKDLNPDQRTFIQSEGLVLIQAIKDLKPAWVYGTSTPDLMRFLSFDSMFILPATQFKGDVFVAPFTLMKRPAFNEEIISEMRRRNKWVFLGPIENKEQLIKAQQFHAEGLITENPIQLLKFLSE